MKDWNYIKIICRSYDLKLKNRTEQMRKRIHDRLNRPQSAGKKMSLKKRKRKVKQSPLGDSNSQSHV